MEEEEIVLEEIVAEEIIVEKFVQEEIVVEEIFQAGTKVATEPKRAGPVANAATDVSIIVIRDKGSPSSCC